MHRARGNTLAGTTLAKNQNRSRGLGRAQQDFHRLAHDRCGEIKNRLQAAGFCFGCFALKRLNPLTQLAKALQSRQHGQKLFALKRLFQKIHRPPAHGFDRRFHAALGGEHHDRQVGILFLDFNQHVEAVFTAEVHIEQDGFKLFLLQRLERNLAGFHRFSIMPCILDQEAGCVAKRLVVVNNQKVHLCLLLT